MNNMFTIKYHIGLYIILAMALMVGWIFDHNGTREYEWYVPPGAAFLMWAIIEAFAWLIYYFFFH